MHCVQNNFRRRLHIQSYGMQRLQTTHLPRVCANVHYMHLVHFLQRAEWYRPQHTSPIRIQMLLL